MYYIFLFSIIAIVTCSFEKLQSCGVLSGQVIKNKKAGPHKFVQVYGNPSPIVCHNNAAKTAVVSAKPVVERARLI